MAQNKQWTKSLQREINARFGFNLTLSGRNDPATQAAIQEIRRIGGFPDGVMADRPVEKFIRTYQAAPTGGGRGAPKPAPPQRPALSPTPKPLSGPAAAVAASKKRRSEAELASLQDQDRRVSAFENRLDRQIRGQQPPEPVPTPEVATNVTRGAPAPAPPVPLARPPLTAAANPPPNQPDFSEANPSGPLPTDGSPESIAAHNQDVELRRGLQREADARNPPTGVVRGAPRPAPPVSLASVLPKSPRPPLVVRPGSGVGFPGGKEYPDVPTMAGDYAQSAIGAIQRLFGGGQAPDTATAAPPPAPVASPAPPVQPARPPLLPAGGPPNPRRDPVLSGRPATAADAVNMEAGRPPLGAPPQTMDYANPDLGPTPPANVERTLGQTSTFHTSAGKTKLDPRLLDTLQRAARAFPLKVEAFSGVAGRATGTKNHPAGKAIDVQIYDQSGKLLPSSPARAKAMGVPFAPAFRVYEQFAQTAKDIQAKLHPDMAFRWGGYFVQGTSFDLMHFDVTSNSMAAGTWEDGLKDPYAKQIADMSGGEQPISVGMNDATMQHITALGYTGPDAVAQFQRDNGAKAIDGVIGPETSALVTAKLNGVPPAAVTASLTVPVTAPPTMPVPKADIPNADAIDQMNPPVASAAVPPGVGQGFLQAVIDAPSARWGTGGMKIALAASDLSKQSPAAVDAYFGQVKASNPEVIRAAGAVYQQQPEHFKILEANATPEQLAPLVAGMTPEPNISPRPALTAGDSTVNGAPVPKASASTDGMMVPPRPNLRPRPAGITPDQITASKSFQTAQRDAAMPMPNLRPTSPGITSDQIRQSSSFRSAQAGATQPKSVATSTVSGPSDPFTTWLQSHNGSAAAAEPARPQTTGFEGSPELASNKRPPLTFTAPAQTVGPAPGANATPQQYNAMNPPMPNLRPVVKPADTGPGGFGQNLESHLATVLHKITGTQPAAPAPQQQSGGGVLGLLAKILGGNNAGGMYDSGGATGGVQYHQLPNGSYGY